MSYGLVRGARQSLRKKKNKGGKNKLSSQDPTSELELPVSKRSDADWEFNRDDLDGLTEIGHGQFGVVYIGYAQNIIPGQARTRVAVKTLADTSEAAKAEFDAEAKIMKAIDNANIVHLLGLSTDKAPQYMIMEFMAKGDLKGFLRDNRPKKSFPSTVSMRQLARMGAGVANGMGYLAGMHIVHRDLAARNCLVSDELAVKVGDFGLTRKTYARDYYRMTGSAPLPIRWMPPESFEDGVFSTASDIWAFGITLWEIHTFGKLPYARLDNGEVAEQVADEDLRLPAPGGCPAPIYEVMMVCWEEDAPDRSTFEKHKASLEAVAASLDDSPLTYEAMQLTAEADEGNEYEYLDGNPGAGYENPSAGYDQSDVASSYDQVDVTAHDYGLPSPGTNEYGQRGQSEYANPVSFVERAEGLQATVSGWIAAVTGSAVDAADLQGSLKSGEVLCILINKLKAGSVRKIHASKHALKQAENISRFLEGAKAFGLKPQDCFQVDDLFQDDDMCRVVLSLDALKKLQ